MRLLERFNNAERDGRVEYFDVEDVEALIDYLMEQQDGYMALSVVNRGLEIHPDNPSLLITKCNIFFYLDLVSRAGDYINYLQSFENINKNDLDLLLGELYLRRQEKEKADEILHRIADINEGYMKMVAYAYFNSKVYSDASVYLEKLHEATPSDEEVTRELILCYDSLNRYSDAIPLLESVLDHCPYDSEIWYEIGHDYYKTGDYEKAVKAYDYCFVISEDYEALRQMGHALFHDAKFKSALDVYLRCYEHDANDEKIITYIGECYEFLGDTGNATKFYMEALQLNPKQESALCGLCGCLLETEQYEEALTLANKMIDSNLAVCEAYVMKGEVLVQMEKDDEALDAYLHALEYGDDLLNVHLPLAEIYIDKQDYEEALKHLECLDRSNPALSGIPLCFSVVYFKLNRLDMAYEQLLEAILRDDDSKNYFFQYCPEAEEVPRFKALQEKNSTESFHNL